jgi:hypothetical protein
MNKIPKRALLFVVAVTLAAATVVAHAMSGMHVWHRYESLTLLVIALVASRLRLRLPGLTGNMSVNVPFILIAMVQLSLVEAIVVGVASTITQCFPKQGGKPKAMQVVFNVGTVAVAVGLGRWILQHPLAMKFPVTSAGLLLSLSAATFFLAQTIPVATIISLTEGGNVVRIWSSIFHLSFPYYVLSAGVTSIVTIASQTGWRTSLLVLPVMYGVYCSYRLYFGRAVEPRPSMALAKGASC